jgi:hypothetical protein
MFEQIEPRDVVYRAAVELVKLRIAEQSDLSLAEEPTTSAERPGSVVTL